MSHINAELIIIEVFATSYTSISLGSNSCTDIFTSMGGGGVSVTENVYFEFSF